MLDQRCRSKTQAQCNQHAELLLIVLQASQKISMGWVEAQAGPALSNTLFKRGFNEGVQVAVQYFLSVRGFNIGT